MGELPKYTTSNLHERIGVHKVGLLLTELGFIFRESSNTDVGIDGQIEYVNNIGEATGKIVAVQIKSGDSFLNDSKSDSENWIFYADKKHQYYWERFPIPVILFVNSLSCNKVFFVDVRHYIKINGLGIIKIPKKNILDSTTKSKIFENVGNFDEPFLEIKDVFDEMIRNKSKSPLFNVSYFDLYLQGITNMGRQIYFDVSIAMDIAECRNASVALSFREYEFLYEYFRFLVNQNLAEIDLGDCLVEWNDLGLVPRFLATLTNRGRALSKFICELEVTNSSIMPETVLIQERLLQLKFDTYSYNRIKKAEIIQNTHREGRIIMK